MLFSVTNLPSAFMYELTKMQLNQGFGTHPFFQHAPAKAPNSQIFFSGARQRQGAFFWQIFIFQKALVILYHLASIVDFSQVTSKSFFNYICVYNILKVKVFAIQCCSLFRLQNRISEISSSSLLQNCFTTNPRRRKGSCSSSMSVRSTGKHFFLTRVRARKFCFLKKRQHSLFLRLGTSSKSPS